MAVGEREKAEFNLRVSEELNRRIIEAMPGGIVHVGADGTIRTANAEALRVLGFAYDELTRKYTRDFEPVTIFEDGSPCTNEDYPVTRALLTGEPQRASTIGVVKPDGELSWAVFTAVPVRDPETQALTGAVVTFLDVTERKRLAAQMVVTDRLAALGVLAAGVAHEINNPLTYVLGHLEWLYRDAQRQGSPELERLSDAMEGLERIGRIVKDLGAFGETRVEPSVAIDVHEPLESSIRLARAELGSDVLITRSYHASQFVRADFARLGQVFLNLLINASHAMRGAGVTPPRIALHSEVTGDGRVCVSVSDSGGGVAPEIAPRIFEPFFTTKPVGYGSGLGLFVCQHIVQGLGGTLTLDNRPGIGATFRVFLPMASRGA